MQKLNNHKQHVQCDMRENRHAEGAAIRQLNTLKYVNIELKIMDQSQLLKSKPDSLVKQK